MQRINSQINFTKMSINNVINKQQKINKMINNNKGINNNKYVVTSSVECPELSSKNRISMYATKPTTKQTYNPTI